MTVSALADHLWQSTWFALGAWLLTLTVRGDAKLRYWIWLAASLKFLVPFSILTLLGRQLVLQVEDEALLPLVQHVAAPLTWMAGSFLLLAHWIRRWTLTRTLVRESVACEAVDDLGLPIPVRCTNALDEPGVVGILAPVLLIPAHLFAKLTPTELRCVVAHELWHVRRRDNLTASMHSLVQILFWFHPLVWWIGARLVETREHACDEGALRDGADSTTYAAAILRVCRHSVEARALCVASAAGGDLKARIRSIMSRRGAPRFRAIRQVLLAGALAGCVVLPVTAGITVVSASQLQVAAGTRAIWRSDDAGPSFIAVRDSYVYARNVSLRQLISHAYGVDDHDVQGDLPWLDRPRFNVELRAPDDSEIDHRELVAGLLKEQFNLELIVRPTARVRQTAGLQF